MLLHLGLKCCIALPWCVYLVVYVWNRKENDTFSSGSLRAHNVIFKQKLLVMSCDRSCVYKVTAKYRFQYINIISVRYSIFRVKTCSKLASCSGSAFSFGMCDGRFGDGPLAKQTPHRGITADLAWPTLSNCRYVRGQMTSCAEIYCFGLCSGGAAPNSHATAGQV